MITFIFFLAISGLFVGALGRLVVPGRNPMGILATIAVGLSGSFLGGLISRLVFGWRLRYSAFFGLLISVLFAALIVYLIQQSRNSDHRR